MIRSRCEARHSLKQSTEMDWRDDRVAGSPGGRYSAVIKMKVDAQSPDEETGHENERGAWVPETAEGESDGLLTD